METINQVTERHLFLIDEGIGDVNLPQDDYFSPTDFRLAKTTKSDISYRVFTSEYTSSACDHSVLPKFEADVPVKFLIHGWTTNETSPWYDLLKSAYFKKGAHRVVFVDWSVAGTKKYSVSAANSKPIGEYLGDFIVDSGVSLGLVHLVGHSLGSHVASFAGKMVLKRTGKKVGRITALDPALPKFEGAPAECGLHVEDAEFVDVVHTDVGHYGYTRPAGHVDFYPNGGKDQPG
ncbi:PREDICTED: lipase member H-A, partial [Nicrophorus vespilloides]|uniref:Lipase member H-A n=1 Tax=Nicrophorus vespilloides TaxID=110193 RepID=A0ABM1M1G2_NICVS